MESKKSAHGDVSTANRLQGRIQDFPKGGGGLSRICYSSIAQLECMSHIHRWNAQSVEAFVVFIKC
jgi:hypothetical protein